MNRPEIVLSWAQSLDGRIATASGDSQWIGGPESLRLAHELRRDNDAILVGIETVLKDDPRLTCRLVEGRNPVRVILDSRLRLPVSAQIADTAAAATWVYCLESSARRQKNLEEQGVVVVPTKPDSEGRLELSAILEDVAARGIKTLFVEGGASILTSFLRHGLVDRAVVVTAPFLIGTGVDAVGDLGNRVLADIPRPVRWRRWELGNDIATELWFS